MNSYKTYNCIHFIVYFIQRQIIEQQEKLRIQQLQEQQKQLLLQQQLQRQNQSVVQTIASATNTVPLVKSSPTPVIHHQSHTNIQTSRSQPSTANTIIVLNDEYLSQPAADALKCIQASDGSYHVIGNVDLNERHLSNTTSVIAHTSPTTETTSSSTRKKRGRTAKQNNIVTTYTHQSQTDNNQIITMENVYHPREITMVQQNHQNNKVTNSKRKRATQTATTSSAASTSMEPTTISLNSNQAVIQNMETPDVPPQQFYLAYNDNGVLVPIETSSSLIKNHTQDNNSGVVDLSHDQYIIEDLDASRKAQQKCRNKTTPVASSTSTSASSTILISASTSNDQLGRAIVQDTQQTSNTNDGIVSNDLSAYNIDDLSHLDKPITSAESAKVVPIKPLKTKPQFMDSFFSFLMNREANKL